MRIAFSILVAMPLSACATSGGGTHDAHMDAARELAEALQPQELKFEMAMACENGVRLHGYATETIAMVTLQNGQTLALKKARGSKAYIGGNNSLDLGSELSGRPATLKLADQATTRCKSSPTSN